MFGQLLQEKAPRHGVIQALFDVKQQCGAPKHGGRFTNVIGEHGACGGREKRVPVDVPGVVAVGMQGDSRAVADEAKNSMSSWLAWV